jgi:hypothetical protein
MSTKKTSTAAAPLRRIAVHVEEARPGRFAWVLSELSQEPDAFLTEIGRAARPVRSYQEAMAKGLWELQSMVDDLEMGPRESASGSASASASLRRKAAGSGKTAEGADDDEPASDSAPAKSTGRTAFGFGLVR